MALLTFIPPVEPSAGLQDKPEIKLLEASFGDGYTQAAPDGLNNIRAVMTLEFGLLERDERDQIVGFFRDHQGATPFLYALPGDDQPTAYRCSEWSISALGADLWNVSATFKQAFGVAP